MYKYFIASDGKNFWGRGETAEAAQLNLATEFREWWLSRRCPREELKAAKAEPIKPDRFPNTLAMFTSELPFDASNKPSVGGLGEMIYPKDATLTYIRKNGRKVKVQA